MGEAAKKLEPSPSWQLVNTLTKQSIPLKHGFRIGRAEGDLILGEDGSVSSRHCLFKFNVDDTEVQIEDVGSRNGTLVDGKKIEAKKPVTLKPGSKIEIGNNVFEFQAVGEIKNVLQEEFSKSLPGLQLVSQPDFVASAEPKEAQKPVWKKPTEPVRPALKLVNQNKPTKTNTVSVATTSAPRVSLASINDPKPAAACLVFIVINFVMFFWEVSNGADFANPTSESLIHAGGNINFLTTGGQWWRLVTSSFLHMGFGHILATMLALYSIGMPVVRLTGGQKFTLVYLASGFLGSVAGLFTNPANKVSVGASGSVFGIVGALLALQMLGHSGAKSIGKFGIFTTLYFIIRNLGLGVEGIDVSAHVGGLASGFAITYFVSMNGDLADKNRPKQAAFGTLALSLVLMIMAPHKGSPTPVLHDIPTTEFGTHFKKIDAVLTDSGTSVRAMITRVQQKEIAKADMINVFRGKMIPALAPAIEDFESAPATTAEEIRVKEIELEIANRWKEMLTELTLIDTPGDTGQHNKRIDELKPLINSKRQELDKALNDLNKSQKQ